MHCVQGFTSVQNFNPLMNRHFREIVFSEQNTTDRARVLGKVKCVEDSVMES